MYGKKPARALTFSGDALRAEIARAGLDRTKLAADLGKTPEAVRRYETEQTIPRVDILCRIADLLGCEITKLLRRRRRVAAGK